MKFVKLLILCICFVYNTEALHNFRMSERKKHYQIDDLKMRLNYDKKSGDDNNIIPPYIRKYNRRFKSIYESMHKGNLQEQKKNMMMNYEKNFRSKKNNGRDKNVYGHFEKYQHDQYRTNEIPQNDILSEIIHKSGHHKKYHQHNHHKHHHSNKIKKLRTKPEAGIMQKKIKI